MTNFPTKGEDKKISLRNSNHPQFDFDFASNVKEQTPEIFARLYDKRKEIQRNYR